MATVTPGEGMSGEPFEVPDHKTVLLDYYRGEGYEVVLDEEPAADEEQESVGYVEPFVAVEHPADGTWSPEIGADSEAE